MGEKANKVNSFWAAYGDVVVDSGVPDVRMDQFARTFTEGNKDASVWGMNFAALKRFMNSWFTLSSR